MSLYTSIDINFNTKDEYDSFKEFLSSRNVSVGADKVEIGSPSLLFSLDTSETIRTAMIFLTENKDSFIAAFVAMYGIWAQKETRNSVSVTEQNGKRIVVNGKIANDYLQHLIDTQEALINSNSNNSFFSESVTVNQGNQPETLHDISMEIVAHNELIDDYNTELKNISHQPWPTVVKISFFLLLPMMLLPVYYRELTPHTGSKTELIALVLTLLGFLILTTPLWRMLKKREKQRDALYEDIQRSTTAIKELSHRQRLLDKKASVSEGERNEG